MSEIYSGKRIFYFDELRMVAILAIILCHAAGCYGNFKYDSLRVAIPGLINVIGLVGVPLFFMLSGALLLNRTYSLPEFFRKKFKRILYPAVFWIAVACFIYSFISTDAILPVIFGDGRFTWFVWVMIGIYLIIPVVNSFIKEFGIKGAEYFLAVWFITIILETFGMYPFKRLELSYFAGYLGYVVLGYYLANKEFKMNKLTLAILCLAVSVISLLIHMYLVYNGIKFKHQYLVLTVMLASMGIFILFKSISEYCDENKTTRLGKFHEKMKSGNIAKLIFTISICSYGMYFANSVIKIFFDQMQIHSLKVFPALYLILVFGSLAVILIMDRIPILNKFSGVS